MTLQQYTYLAVTLVVIGFGNGALAQPTASPSGAMFEATFKPLLRSESGYAALGPAGPFYPRSAISRNGKDVNVLRGDAVLECKSTRSGELNDCKIVSANPLKEFGLAAKVMAARRRLSVAGGPVDGQVVQVHVPFDPGTTAQVAP